eukprot:TRINITY_DN5144_c0_g1_i1.p2 TRINITY_DN5144_c0_g1~~TRINITY_DN5144_c0_g1_i1.p2  ORF type:complete len:100 (-),score=22.42 TRINITY_DN5144_c0_g1_i1:18-317(-)
MLTLGPLSNVARALELEPRIAERLVRIVIMGGELSGTTGLDLNFAMDRPAVNAVMRSDCLLYTSDAADEEDSVDLGGRRIIKKKKKLENKSRRVTCNTI